MKKFLPALILPLMLSGCVGMSTTDGDSTKQWIKIVSSKSDLGDSKADVCYQLDLRFNPPHAEDRIDTDKACITRCCWYSEHKSVQLNFNDQFIDELLEYGVAKKYMPDSLIINVNYSSFLNTIHARADQKNVLSSDGTVNLDFNEVAAPENYLDLDFGTAIPKIYEEDQNLYSGKYLFSKDEQAQQELKHQIQEQQKKNQAEAAAILYEEANADELKAAAATRASYKNMDEEERRTLLEKKLSYERKQSIILLKRFYEKDIDAYIMAIDKAKKAKGQVLITNDRDWTTLKIGTPIYRVSCKVNGKLGKTLNTMKDFPISCGTYEVNLDEKTVNPVDTAAISIVNGEYMD